nr:immunoglobulin heavy chain junction region [Macaca mulatta]MOW87283.1 immunoglobulin heavy chain junction region [Macaca mulatta]MOW87559.1 immunoglobulin heavy chain junction region [Macaca mulatta]MOW87603.1 immunoglobulin heavy chain junction region [Macaca mulatta]MOW87721.1 immunoglobulin heavy chain junction region [Macaca mulatta]
CAKPKGVGYGRIWASLDVW